jgi:hypothetical protein
MPPSSPPTIRHLRGRDLPWRAAEGIHGENPEQHAGADRGPAGAGEEGGEADISPLKADTVADDAGPGLAAEVPGEGRNPPKIKHRTNSSRWPRTSGSTRTWDAVDGQVRMGNFPGVRGRRRTRETNEIITRRMTASAPARVPERQLVDLDKPIQIIVIRCTQVRGQGERATLDSMFTNSYNGSTERRRRVREAETVP